MNNWMLGCAFVAGLMDEISQLLQATSRMDELLMEQLLTRARAICKESEPVIAAATARTDGGAVSQLEIHTASDSSTTGNCDNPVSYKCSDPNHFARECWSRCSVVSTETAEVVSL